MNTCGTCKWWNDYDPDDDPLMGYCPGFSKREDQEYKVCTLIDIPLGDQDKDAKNAYVNDAEGYYAELRTAASFGCNEWEAE